uniref:NADH dehydrogenase subunit 2 n=1 Tax=Jogocerus viraktamathi TaxID=3111112 RepID=UPI002E7796DE|nr:NADH dehydrogenase subunit 2 [Jogocerus viraktamathi]WRK19226.1 NADH dehydrogenase subunit 2 [Jogocerus viraktamathi]
MYLNSTSILFFTSMIMGVIMSLSSNSWIMIWIGMEISLMSFVPTMVSKLKTSSESSMKYFIIQSISSAIFILSVMFTLMGVNVNFTTSIALSMMIKMGAAPFHSWVLSIINGMNYLSIFILITLMKLTPMMIIMNLNQKNNMIIIACLILGSISGLIQNSIYKIMVYSSTFNMGFLIYSCNNFSIWILYFALYSLNLALLFNILNQKKILYLNQFMVNNHDLKLKMSIWILMLSMSGFPPMLGFMSKLIVIELAIKFSDWIMVMIMILGSLITMFYYNRLCFISLFSSNLMVKWNLNSTDNKLIIVTIINCTMLPTALLLKYLN